MEVGYRIEDMPGGPSVGYIYIIYDKADGVIRYVGQTIRLEARYMCHCQSKRGDQGRLLRAWRDGIMAQGRMPVMEVVEVCELSKLTEREKSFIQAADIPGSGLLNAKHTRSCPQRRLNKKEITRDGWLAERLAELSF